MGCYPFQCHELASGFTRNGERVNPIDIWSSDRRFAVLLSAGPEWGITEKAEQRLTNQVGLLEMNPMCRLRHIARLRFGAPGEARFGQRADEEVVLLAPDEERRGGDARRARPRPAAERTVPREHG